MTTEITVIPDGPNLIVTGTDQIAEAVKHLDGIEGWNGSFPGEHEGRPCVRFLGAKPADLFQIPGRTDAVERAAEAIVREEGILDWDVLSERLRDHPRGLARAGLAAGLDVGDMAQILRQADDTYSRDDGAKTGHDYARHLAADLRAALLGEAAPGSQDATQDERTPVRRGHPRHTRAPPSLPGSPLTAVQGPGTALSEHLELRGGRLGIVDRGYVAAVGFPQRLLGVHAG
jgi:hypothetical protein